MQDCLRLFTHSIGILSTKFKTHEDLYMLVTSHVSLLKMNYMYLKQKHTFLVNRFL